MYELVTERRCWEDLNPTKIIINLAKEKSPFSENWEQQAGNS